MNNLAYIKTATGLEVIIDCVPFSVPSSHVRYDDIVSALSRRDTENLKRLIDVSGTITDYTAGAITIGGGLVKFRNHELHGTMVERLLAAIQSKTDFWPIAWFADKVCQNTTKSVLTDLYAFLERGKMPLTPEGDFLAYKVVRADYKDRHSGTMDNSVGQVVRMDRIMVDDNRNQTCSTGLHACSFEYIKEFYGHGCRIVIVQINPKDVVSIPPDYNLSKMRVCEYKVIADVTDIMVPKMHGDGSDAVLNQNSVIDADEDFDDNDVIDEGDEVGIYGHEESEEEPDDHNDDECPHCGSSDTQKRGHEWRSSGNRMVQRHKCNDCKKNWYTDIE